MNDEIKKKSLICTLLLSATIAFNVLNLSQYLVMFFKESVDILIFFINTLLSFNADDFLYYYLGVNLFLYLTGRNIRKWNKKSNADSYIKRTRKPILTFRYLTILLMFILTTIQYFQGNQEVGVPYYNVLIYWFIILGMVEIYHLFFKFIFAQSAINACSQRNDSYRRISKIDKTIVVKGSCHNPVYNTNIENIYELDYDERNNKWFLNNFYTKKI